MRWRTRGPAGYGYGPGYGYRRPYGYGSAPGGSCLRDACLIETGCCIGEALEGNCLLTGILLLPRFLTATLSGGSVVGAIRVYQRDISAHRPAVCRFTPSCSEYTAQAVQAHGTWRGLRLGVARLLRCRPGGARGADPVPAPGTRPA